MTASTISAGEWAGNVWGKVARVAVLTLGSVTAILSLLLGVAAGRAAWIPIVLGLALAATSARAAAVPTVGRISTMAGNLLAIVLVAQLL